MALQGLASFRAALRRLPEDLAAEAGEIVEAQAAAVAQDTRGQYPVGPTGNLRRGVAVTVQAARAGTSAIVTSKAKHARLFENGTKRRQTAQGYNRGAMPEAEASRQMIPKAIRARQRMTAALIALVRRAGFEVDA